MDHDDVQRIARDHSSREDKIRDYAEKIFKIKKAKALAKARASKGSEIVIPGRDFINLSRVTGPKKACIIQEEGIDYLAFKQANIRIMAEDNWKTRELIPAGIHFIKKGNAGNRIASLLYHPDHNFLWNVPMIRTLQENLDLIKKYLFKLGAKEGQSLDLKTKLPAMKSNVGYGYGLYNPLEKAQIWTSLKAIHDKGTGIFQMGELEDLFRVKFDENKFGGRLFILSGERPDIISFYVDDDPDVDRQKSQAELANKK